MSASDEVCWTSGAWAWRFETLRPMTRSIISVELAIVFFHIQFLLEVRGLLLTPQGF
jgi:hypothetical protein